MKAEFLAKMRYFVGQKHEEQMLRLMGIIKVSNLKSRILLGNHGLSYSKDNDEEIPGGYDQVYQWLYKKMDGKNDDALEEAVQQEKVIDIYLDGQISGDNQDLPEVKITKFSVSRW